MHELPQLGKLEEAFRDELAVIGVHSPKYPAEAVPANLRLAVERYGIRHPVVNDPEYRVWDSYAVNAWPTLVFLSPTGEVIGRHAGEATFEALSHVVQELIAEYDRQGTLDRSVPPVTGEAWTKSLERLSFPGKVLATRDRLLVADSGNNRILAMTLQGSIEQIIGSGRAGMQDGDPQSAQFHAPQGMAIDEAAGLLYVADAENHAIRRISLRTGRVDTIAGTGEQAHRAARSGAGADTALSSPWDVALLGQMLFIAMAGTHQIWSLDLASGTAEVWAGTGHEAIRDGARESCWLAQPMGLALSATTLYISCAESQAVRHVDLHTGHVTTVAGGGLFAFGDKDGSRDEALLQHNQAIAVGRNGALYVADTYNNKIKRVDTDGSIVTLVGSGQAGLLDGPGANARLYEPTGLSILGDSLYVADGNNHAVRLVDLESASIHTVVDGIIGGDRE